MTRNNAKPETTPQPVVTIAPDKPLWQKVSPETAAQVSGGLCSGYTVATG